MIAAWWKHLKTEDEIERFKQTLKASSTVLDRLGELLQEDEQAMDNRETSPKNYELPNWDYRQAHANGYRQCLREIKRLINLQG